jgi:phenolic acid decarboxylase
MTTKVSAFSIMHGTIKGKKYVVNSKSIKIPYSTDHCNICHDGMPIGQILDKYKISNSKGTMLLIKCLSREQQGYFDNIKNSDWKYQDDQLIVNIVASTHSLSQLSTTQPTSSSASTNSPDEYKLETMYTESDESLCDELIERVRLLHINQKKALLVLLDNFA